MKKPEPFTLLGVDPVAVLCGAFAVMGWVFHHYKSGQTCYERYLP